ncbi:ABC transporter permease [Citricoccus sp. GCM10030269]|uniref:ABC transporter permease n=1 Tax=Citricoccus sp. GCM10030269 TaxID=3273388 RepID=UPI0036214C88
MTTVAEPHTVTAATNAPPARVSPRRLDQRHSVIVGAQLAILIVTLALWEILAQAGVVSTFLFASPTLIWQALVQQAGAGTLVSDFLLTMQETVFGFLLGAVGGSLLGLVLWYSRVVARVSAPYIAAIGAIPVLAVAPLIIIWFGTGMLSKVVIVAFSCVVVSLTNAYRGALDVDQDELNLMRSFGASRHQIFTKVVVPSSMTWVVSGLKLNVGLAVIGAIVGEYISSSAGIGHSIQVASANFSIARVMAGLVMVVVLVALLQLAMYVIERLLLPWKRR